MPSTNIRRWIAAALAGVTVAGSLPVQAQAAASLHEVVAANNALVADIEAADVAGGTPPTMSDPAAAARFRTAFDVDALAQMNDDDLASSLDVCGAGVKTMIHLLMFGLKRASVDPHDTAAVAVKTAEIANRNSLAYQDTFIPAMHFGVTCAAGEVRAMNKWAAKVHPETWEQARRQGAIQARRGLVEVYVGAIGIQVEAFKPEYKQLMLDDLVTFRETFAATMQQPERDQVQTQIDAVLASPALDPAARPKLALIVEALKTAPCSALCQI